MRTTFLSLFSVIVGSILLISSNVMAQTSKPDVKLYFQRQDNGKVAIINAIGQKVLNFQVSGLLTQTDVSNFKSKFEGRQSVVSITISEAEAAGDRSGSIIFDRGTKGSYMRDLLIKAGFSHIYIDGTLYSVDELGNDK